MGPKREKARDFVMSDTAFDVSRDDAIAWANGVLDASYEEVETMATEGWAWCQLLHYCTIPEEGIVDLKAVWFKGQAAATEERGPVQNYAIAQRALAELGVTCEYANDAAVEKLLEGSYSEAIDLLHWMKYFVEYMGKPMFYHAGDERAEASPAPPAPAPAKTAAKPGAKRAVGVKDRTGVGAAAGASAAKVPARAAVTARKPAAKVSTVVPVATARTATRGAAAAAPAASAAEIAALKEKLAAAQATADTAQQVATAMALKFDGAITHLNKYLNTREDVPEEVKAEVATIMAESLQ